MTNIIKKKIASVFEKDNLEYGYAGSYLAELRTNWRETEKSITRSSGLIVGLSVLFELVFSNKASATSFLTIKLTNTSIIQFSLLVIVAYLYYTAIYSFTESQVLSDTHDAIIEMIYPALYKSDGELLLAPANSLTSSVDKVSNALEANSRERGLASITGGIRPVVILFGPPLFIIVANIQLFVRYGLANGLLWGSLVITGTLLFAGCINLYLLWEVV